MWGIGASLEVEDEGGGEILGSGFKDSVSSLGVANDFGCLADMDFLVFDLSAGDAGFVYEIGGDGIGECEGRSLSGISGGVNASSLESNVESGDFEREVCKPPSPLASADNRSPRPSDVLRFRVVGESDSAASWDGFGGSEANGGMAEFSPTSCPISTSGFVGRRPCGPEARDIALPGRGTSEASGASSDEDDSEDDSEDVEALERARGGGCVGLETENGVNTCIKVKRRKRTCRRVPGECRGTLRHGLRHERRRRATDACARVDARRTAPIAGTLGVW